MRLHKIRKIAATTAFIILLFAVVAGCEKSFSSIDDFEKYVKGEDSPYRQTIIKNGVKVSLLFLTPDAVMIPQYKMYDDKMNKLAVDTTLTNDEKKERSKKELAELEETKKSYENSLHFLLTIGYEDEKRDIVYDKSKAGYNEYSQWLNKLLFSLKKYIYLSTEDIDEVPPSLCYMERSFEMTRFKNIILQFPKSYYKINLSNNQKNCKLNIKEFGLGVGLVSFEFDLSKLLNHKLMLN